MSLIKQLHSKALQHRLIDTGAEMNLETIFALVRDMPYQRASDRKPETIIAEWRGTCSGKHYTLQALFAELGYRSDVVACTSIEPIAENIITPELRPLWENAAGRLVDVHNYLLLDLPGGKMIIDATWPLGSQKHGLKVNRSFCLGEDQQIACQPLQNWLIPDGADPQAFKDKLLSENFSSDELAFREAFIQALGDWLAQ